ncbi:restriction endonuclease subunit S [Candidatus Fermentibacteria bacterium]|nr:MAG: restriction endonuclease subunit S [Candidatus Fermentibacteria bacterium]
MIWKRVRLDEVAIVERGKFSARPRNDKKYYGGDIPFLQTGDVSSSNGTVTNFKQTLNEKGLFVSRLFPAGTLLVTIAANIGDVADVAFDFACPDSLVAVRPVGENNRIWLKYLLQSKKAFFKSRATQNAQANINLQVIRPMMILLPPLPEQRAIADLLSTWDEAIEKTQKLIEAKEKQFKWLLNELIGNYCKRTGKQEVKLLELFKNTLKVEKGKPLIKKVIEDGQIPVVAGGQSYAYYHNKATHKGECITISASGAYAGYVWYHNYPIWASDCNVIVAKEGETKFFYYALKHLQAKIYALQSGGAQPHIYSKDLNTLTVPRPPLFEKKQIAATLSTAQEEIDLLKKMAERYREQKRGLMQKLLTGEWRVKLEGA